MNDEISQRLARVEQRLEMVSASAKLTEDLLVEIMRIHPMQDEVLACFVDWQERFHASALQSTAPADSWLETLQTARENLLWKIQGDVDPQPPTPSPR